MRLWSYGGRVPRFLEGTKGPHRYSRSLLHSDERLWENQRKRWFRPSWLFLHDGNPLLKPNAGFVPLLTWTAAATAPGRTLGMQQEQMQRLSSPTRCSASALMWHRRGPPRLSALLIEADGQQAGLVMRRQPVASRA